MLTENQNPSREKGKENTPQGSNLQNVFLTQANIVKDVKYELRLSRESKKGKGAGGGGERHFFLSDQREDISSSGGTSPFQIFTCKRNPSRVTDQGCFGGRLSWSGHTVPVNTVCEVTAHTSRSG